jgi:hypothetical protein
VTARILSFRPFFFGLFSPKGLELGDFLEDFLTFERLNDLLLASRGAYHVLYFPRKVSRAIFWPTSLVPMLEVSPNEEFLM